MRPSPSTLATLITALVFSPVVLAQATRSDTAPTGPAGAAATTAPRDGSMTTPRPGVAPSGAIGASSNAATRSAVAGDESVQLQTMLRGASSRQDLQNRLERAGWRISSVNEDDGDEVEYEIVKGSVSYEVEAEFSAGAAGNAEVDVKPNLWRASSTKQMMKDPEYRANTPLAASPESMRYRDSQYRQAWTDEKTKIERALGANERPEQYRAKLEQMGYQVTSVNERESDHVEYEIVKGDQSYEVQIALDPGTKLGTSVNVSTNMWESEATERRKN